MVSVVETKNSVNTCALYESVCSVSVDSPIHSFTNAVHVSRDLIYNLYEMRSHLGRAILLQLQ